MDDRCAKAGIMIFDIFQHHEVQPEFFAEDDSEYQSTGHCSSRSAEVIAIIDKFSKRYGQNSDQQSAVFIASEGIKNKQSWQISHDMTCYRCARTILQISIS